MNNWGRLTHKLNSIFVNLFSTRQFANSAGNNTKAPRTNRHDSPRCCFVQLKVIYMQQVPVLAVSPTALFYQLKVLFLDNLLAILNDDAFYRCVGSATVEGVHLASSVRLPTSYFLDSCGLVDGTAAAE